MTREMTKEESKIVARKSILESARKEFGRHGYIAARMIEIANGCRYAVGAPYFYFPDKYYLYLAVIQDALSDFCSRISGLSGDDPRKDLINFFAWMSRCHEINFLFSLIFLPLNLSFDRKKIKYSAMIRQIYMTREEIRKKLEEIISRCQKEKILKNDITSKMLASFVIGGALDNSGKFGFDIWSIINSLST